jgi:hypothetical protein
MMSDEHQAIRRHIRAPNSELAIIVIRSRTNQLEHLLPLVPAVFAALQSVEAGRIIVVPL